MLKERSLFHKLVEEARYLKIILIFNVQSVLPLPQSVRQAASVVIAKRPNDKTEVGTLEKMMNFTSRDQEKVMMGLKKPTGVFVDKERGAIPVPVIIPNYPERIVSDPEIDAFQQGYIDNILKVVVPSQSPEFNAISTEDHGLSINQKYLLEDLRKFPFDFQQERAQRLNLNTRIVNDILRELDDLGLVQKEDTTISRGKGKGPFQSYLLTEAAEALVGSQVLPGRGAIAHKFYQSRAAKYFSQRGYKTTIEQYLDDGGWVDLEAIKGDEKIAMEIELGDDIAHIRQNIYKCMEAGYSHIIVAVYGSQILKRVGRTAMRDPEIDSWLTGGRLILDQVEKYL